MAVGYDSSYDAVRLYQDGSILDIGSLKKDVDDKDDGDFQSVYTKLIPTKEFKKPNEDKQWWVYAVHDDKGRWHFYASSRKLGVIRYGEIKYREYKLLRDNPFSTWNKGLKAFPIHCCSSRSKSHHFKKELFKQSKICTKSDFYYRVRELADSVADRWRSLLKGYLDRKVAEGGTLTKRDLLLQQSLDDWDIKE